MVTVGVGVWPLFPLALGGGDGAIIKDLDHFVVHETLEGRVIHIGVSDLALLVWAEMEYLATGKGNPNRCMGLVPNGLHEGTS